MKMKSYPTLEAMQHLDELRGRFVQIRWKGEPWLLIASKDQHQFHNLHQLYLQQPRFQVYLHQEKNSHQPSMLVM